MNSFLTNQNNSYWVFCIVYYFLLSFQLISDQRCYYKAVKEFHEDCTKNDWLNTELDEIREAR